MNDRIEISNLTKEYSMGKVAVNHINLSIGSGEIFGFLGPNGAGKTTTVKLLTGMLSPTDGEAKVFGFDTRTHKVKIHEISGVVTEQAGMYDGMSAIENLSFYGEVFGMKKDNVIKKSLELLEALGLLEAANQKLATYSTGMRQRLSLARALIHSPRFLLLDEPTSGLDPESARGVNQMIQHMAKERGCTVFLCTHQLRYAQELCTSYGLIDEGRILASGHLEELRNLVFPGHRVKVKATHIPASIPTLKGVDGYEEISLSSEEEIPDLVRKIVSEGGNIYHISASQISLEEIYFALIKRREGEIHDL